MSFARRLPNERCSRQALFGCGFAAMVVVCSDALGSILRRRDL
jgi:hypothetical protein